MERIRQNSRGRISPLLLERYRLGEVRADERKIVEAELAVNSELAARCERLDASDRELRLRYPALKGAAASCTVTAAAGERRSRVPGAGVRRFYAPLCAAALLLCVAFPSLHYFRERSSAARLSAGGISSDAAGDRIKGTELKTELSVYLREARGISAFAPLADAGEEGRKLPDSTILKEGSTVQLAYATPPGAVYYGVIFSIDGRQAVTVHYPYQMGETPVLAAGKRTFLSEAYTLDDAPDFEIFFLVVSGEPLDTEKILSAADDLAKDPKTAVEKSSAAFEGCEVETVIIRK